MNSQEIHKWKRELAQEKASRKSAEKVLEKKSAENNRGKSKTRSFAQGVIVTL